MAIAYSVKHAEDGTLIFNPDTPEVRADFIKTFDEYQEMKCFYYEVPKRALTEG